MRRHLSITDIDKWNMNLQNWLYDVVRTFDDYVFCSASNIHAVHPNVLSHFLVLQLPLQNTLVQATLSRIPVDVSGAFWSNYAAPRAYHDFSRFTSQNELYNFCRGHSIDPTRAIDDTRQRDDFNIELDYMTARQRYTASVSEARVLYP